MALTPRSFLRSPTLLVAAIFSGVIAMLGIAAFSAVFCSASKPTVAKCKKGAAIDQMRAVRASTCGYTLTDKPTNQNQWSEADFVEVATCLERNEEAAMAVDAAVRGLRHYPASEVLHNIRGYNLIVQEKYEEAVHALRTGVSAVREPATGTLQNNLAWAGLFANDMMTLSEARKHYQGSLAVESNSCEALHTGMWVEYGVASRSNGSSRDAAIGAYWILRGKYEPCTARANYGDRITKFEVAGAGILDAEMTKLGMIQMFERFHKVDQSQIQCKEFDTSLVSSSVAGLDLRTANDIQNACEDIAPVASARPECRKALLAAAAD